MPDPINRTAQQIDPNSTLGTGVPTKTPDSVSAVSNEITPNPTPLSTAPTSGPSAPPQSTDPTKPVPAPPAGPINPPPAPAAPAPQTKGEWFNHILKSITPPQNVIRTSPDGQQTVTDQRTAPSMTKMFMASVMAGMMAPTKYREGAYGLVVDSSGTAAGAFQAGAEKGKELSGAAQKQYDDMTSRKLNAVAANTNAMHQYASMQTAQSAAEKEGAEAEALQTKNWNDITDQNKSTILASADDYDNNRNDKMDPKARLTSGMTTEELLASPFKDKMTSQLMVQDGTRSVFDPKTGKQKTVPTWTVLNPDVDVKLNQAMVERAAKINPGFKNLYEATNGNVRLNLGRAVAITHQMNSVDHAEDLLQGIADSDDKDLKALGIHGDVEGRLATAAQGNSTAMKALMEFESATAHGGNTAAQLQRLLTSDGGDAIFKALGTDRDKVTAYVNKIEQQKTSADALAKMGGIGEKAPAAQDQVQRLVQSIDSNPDLTDSDKTNLRADVPTPDKEGVIHMNQAQAEKLTARLDSAVSMRASIKEKNALANGDPVTMQNTAKDIIGGDFDNLSAIVSKRGNALQNTAHAVHEAAEKRGLDTTQYSQPALEAKAKMWEDYAGGQKTPTGKQLVSFDNYLGHSAALLDAAGRLESKTLGLTHQPIMNKTLKEIGNQLTDDKDWSAYTAALEPVKHEIENFLAAGYATKSEDAANMNALLSDKLPLNQVKSVIRQLADTADVRLKGLGQAYVNTMGTTYPHLMSIDAQNSLKRMGIESKALPFTQPLPRGWNGDQPTQMTDKNMARAFFQAAGNDRNTAVSLAKTNGWTLQ
jgi:hypothetical protein